MKPQTMNIRILISWLHPLSPVIPGKSLKDTPRDLNHNGLLSWSSPLKMLLFGAWRPFRKESLPLVSESAFCSPLWLLCKGWVPLILVFCPDVFRVFQGQSGNVCAQLSEWWPRKNFTLHPL